MLLTATVNAQNSFYLPAVAGGYRVVLLKEPLVPYEQRIHGAEIEMQVIGAHSNTETHHRILSEC